VQVELVAYGRQNTLVVRLDSAAGAGPLIAELEATKTFKFPVSGEPPPGGLLNVKLLIEDHDFEFATTIVDWPPGLAILRPLSGSLAAQLRTAIEGEEGESTAAAGEARPKRRRRRRTKRSRPPGEKRPRRKKRRRKPQKPAAESAAERAPEPEAPDLRQTGAHAVPGPPDPDRRTFDNSAEHRRRPAHTPAFGTKAIGADSRVEMTTGQLPAVGATLTFLERVPDDSLQIGSGAGSGSDALFAVEMADTECPQLLLAVDSVTKPGRQWFAFVERGKLRHIYQSPESSQTVLSMLLQRQGVLTEQQAQDVLGCAAEQRISEEDALQELETLDEDFRQKAIKAKNRLLSENLRADNDVTFRILELPRRIAGTGGAVAASAGQFKEIKEELNQKTWRIMQADQEPYLSLCPTLIENPDSMAQKLKVTAKVARFMGNCLDGRLPLRMVYKITSLNRRETYAAIFSLYALDLLTFEERQYDRVLLEELTQVIRAKYGGIRAKTHFEFLDLHWSATNLDIDDVVDNLAAQLGDATEDFVGRDLASRAAQIVDHAFFIQRELDSPEKRKKYRKEIMDVFRVDQGVDLLSAQLEMAIYRRDTVMVNRLLASIAELNPKVGRQKRAEATSKMRAPDDDY